MSRLRVALWLSLMLLVGFAQAALPPIRVGSVSTERLGSSWTFDGDVFLEKTRPKLENPAYFGPNGKVGRSIVITDTTAPIDAALLAQFDVFFIGYFYRFDENYFTNAELNAMLTWVNGGGTMIITCDDNTYGGVCDFFGYPAFEDGPSQNPILPTEAGKKHPLFNGPFGQVDQVNMVGTQGAFTVTEGATVLAVDSSDQKFPGIMVKNVGAGRIILLADVDLVGNGLSVGGTIEFDDPEVNDRFLGNLFAFAGAVTINYTALWWEAPAGSAPGWGVNVAHKGDVIFATWFTYDSQGKPWWLAVVATLKSPGVYSGDLFVTKGPPFNAVPFDPTQVTETVIGTATFTFTDFAYGTFSYTLVTPGVGPAGASKDKAAVAQTRNITRQLFANPVPGCTWPAQAELSSATNYQDIWWRAPASSESGWGINLNHQGDLIFATWFTYDLAGNPWWLAVLAQKVAEGLYSGDLFTTTGPPFNAVPFAPPAIETTVGTAKFTVNNGNSITFDYTVNGITQSKPLTRQVFSEPGTLCY